MAVRAIAAKIIGYTKTHGIYHVISNTGKLVLAKDPKSTSQEDSDEDEPSSEWLKNPIQDLEDIAEGNPGRNYGSHCPEEQKCDNCSYEENPETSGEPKSPPDSLSQQLFKEQQNQETPAAPSKPKAPEPIRRSELMSRNLTSWEDRIKQGLAGKPSEQPIHQVGHDDEHPMDEQARTCPKAHEWAKARDTERQKLQKYGV